MKENGGQKATVKLIISRYWRLRNKSQKYVSQYYRQSVIKAQIKMENLMSTVDLQGIEH